MNRWSTRVPVSARTASCTAIGGTAGRGRPDAALCLDGWAKADLTVASSALANCRTVGATALDAGQIPETAPAGEPQIRLHDLAGRHDHGGQQQARVTT